MEIRVWNSFSCNNSSSYRLVARFETASAAAETVTELRAFFKAHALEVDELVEGGDFPDAPPDAQEALGKKYGFEWSDVLSWGDDMLEGDEPTVASKDDVLIVFHTYCGGFGDLPKYLRARGAKVEREETEPPYASVVFALPEPKNAALEAEIDWILAQIGEDGSREVSPFRAPFVENDCYGTAAFFRDAKTVGLYFPISPEDLPNIKVWLAKHGVKNPSVRLCAYEDDAKFVAISKARCTACKGLLEYLDPRIHGIDREHLACPACGGMFEVENFRAQAESKAEPVVKAT
jgi:hypothetical protein